MLLRKQSHSTQDLQAIIIHSESVYEFVKWRLAQLPKQRRANELLRMLALRMLAVDGLWRACEAVGFPMKQSEWWPCLMQTVFGDAQRWEADVVVPNAVSKLLERVVFLMESFSRGMRPPADQMAQIMREMFHKRTGVRILKGSEWDLWREGDEES